MSGSALATTIRPKQESMTEYLPTASSEFHESCQPSHKLFLTNHFQKRFWQRTPVERHTRALRWIRNYIIQLDRSVCRRINFIF